MIGQPLDQDQGFKADMQETATKFPLSIRETPQSISVITQDALEARQVIDFGQALQTVAGVNQFDGPGPFAGRTTLSQGLTQIRGILSRRADFDEGFVGVLNAAEPDLAPYERIEVVKGPSSVLYGAVAPGASSTACARNRCRNLPPSSMPPSGLSIFIARRAMSPARCSRRTKHAAGWCWPMKTPAPSSMAIDERGLSPFFSGLKVEGYERVDLSLFYNGLKDTQIALQVRNVFDERYIESVNTVFSGHFGAPTAVLLTVRFDLDGLLDGLGK